MRYLSAPILSLILLLLISGCIVERDWRAEPGVRRGDYLGMDKPDSAPLIFAPDIVSTEHEVRDMTISPDGNEIFYTVQWRVRSVIVRIVCEDGIWSSPEIAPFSGRWDDLEPMFAPDGSKLFFASRRPLNNTGSLKDADIWYVERHDTGYGPPMNIGSPVNTDRDEFYPSITADGSLYFTAMYEETEDIWASRLVDGEYQAPERLPDSVNSPSHHEFNAFVLPDESMILFTSHGREDGLGGGDLYVSFKAGDEWGSAGNLGAEVNSKSIDFCPFISPDSAFMFFTSRRTPESVVGAPIRSFPELTTLLNQPENGSMNIFWVDARVITTITK